MKSLNGHPEGGRSDLEARIAEETPDKAFSADVVTSDISRVPLARDAAVNNHFMEEIRRQVADVVCELMAPPHAAPGLGHIDRDSAGELQLTTVLVVGVLTVGPPSTGGSTRRVSRVSLIPEKKLEASAPVFLERFPELSRKRTMKVLKRLFVLGCALKGEANSLGTAEEWLKKRRCPVPCGKSLLSACVNKEVWKEAAPVFFAEFFSNPLVILERREEGDPPPCDSKGRHLRPDTRQIIGLTEEAGWRLWEEAGRFLQKHDPLFHTYASLLSP